MNRILLGLGSLALLFAFTSESNAQYGGSCYRSTAIRSYSTPYYGSHSIGPGIHISRYAAPQYSLYQSHVVPNVRIHSASGYNPYSSYRVPSSYYQQPRYGYGYHPHIRNHRSGVSLRIGF